MAKKGWTTLDELPVDDTFEYGTRLGISDELDSENVQMSFIRFDPGERGPVHFHESPIEEYYLVLDGQLDIWIDGETVRADEGTVVLTPPDTQHYPENNSEQPADLLAVSSPPAGRGSGNGIVVVEDVD